ncbi:Stk1 family PASTA domain-containing Ser/Thr kinase [Actinopolymorpha pittospori]
MEVTVSDPLVGRLLDGRYRVGRRVARGGMATVYEALDTRLDRTVAVKVLHAGLVEDADFLRRFQREARSAARLSHPNVVAVFDQGEDDGTPYLTMEYVPGRTLRQALSDEGPMSPSRALGFLDEVLQALAVAHEAGLVHRDVKPENVLLSLDNSVKVADFGLARAVSTATSTATQGLLIGTVSYLAPEQVTHGVADARADVYAAGIMLYEMLVGAKPHEGESPIQVAYKHVNEDVPEPSRSAPGIPAFIDALVLRATARDPAVRPADARVFLHHLRRARTALREGVDDPELTQDLTVFRRQPTHEHTLIAPLEQLRAASVAPGSSTVLNPDRPDPDDTSDSEVPPEPRRRRPWWQRTPAIGGLVVLLFLAAGGGAFLTAVGPFTRVPPVVDFAQGRLRALGEQAGVRFVVAGQVFDEKVEKGHVVRSVPTQHERTWRGGPVQVWVSLGPELHDVPKLVGVSEERARDLLTEARLRVQGIQESFSDSVAEGRIISTSPSADTPLRRNSGVSLVISKGRQPIDLPSVVNTPFDQARQTLMGLGLTVTNSETFSDTVPSGQVISQQPVPSQVFRGDNIALVVSKGPEFAQVPDVARMPEDQARQTLTDAGFQVEVRQNAVFVGLRVVVSQAPNPGSMARVGSTIVIEIV